MASMDDKLGCTEWDLEAITIESAPLTTTGGHTWQAANRLAAYLAETAEQWGLHRRGDKRSRILELGAGCGYLGLTLAYNLPHVDVVVTEQEAGAGLEWLQHNVQLQQHKFGSRLRNIQAAACDWTLVEQQAGAVLRQPWDLVVGSDLVYNDICATYLPRVLARLLLSHGTQGPLTDDGTSGSAGAAAGDANPLTATPEDCTTPIALYCHTKHRYDMLDLELEAQLAQHGLQLQEGV